MSERTRKQHPKALSQASHPAPPALKAMPTSGGQSLDKHTQATMSARFGHDFSSVRVHTDSRAEDAADALGANAYAMGSDIVFGAGQYQPGSSDTQSLLAHELTHVVQQAQFGGGDWSRESADGDASECEADALASQVMAGRSVHVQAAPQAAVARKPVGVPDNNRWDDWGDQFGGLEFDHPGPPSSFFIKPPLNGSDGTLAPTDPAPKPGTTRQLPLPGPRVTPADPTPEFTPAPAPDPPVPLLPPYQYTPKDTPGLQPSTPIAPFPAPPDMTTPLPPPSLFPPASPSVAPMVPPLTLDPPAPVPAPDLPPLPDDQRYA